MAIKTYPLNNEDYDAADAELFHCTRTSGVWAGDEDFNIGDVSGSDNNIPVLPGLAWIRNAKFSGKVAAQKTPVTLNLGLPDTTYRRIDAIVLQFSANKNATELIVKKGSASSSSDAVPPERIQTEAVYELHLYHVLRKPGAVAITRDDITDLREDEKWCGVMYDDVTPRGTEGFLTEEDKDKPNGVAGLDANKKVIGVTKHFTAKIGASWASSGGIYKQTIDVPGLLKRYSQVHIKPAYSAIVSTAKEERKAYALIDDAKVTSDNKLEFYCFGKYPTMSVNIEIEVIV